MSILGMMPYQFRKTESLEVLFILGILFSITDALTTWTSLAIGLREANVLLLVTTRFFGLSLVEVIVITKAVFIFSSGIATFFTLHARETRIRSLLFVILAPCVLALMAVSVHNLVLLIVLGA